MGHRKTYKVRVKLDSPLSDQTGEGYPLTRFISLRGLFLTSLMAIHRKIALLPLRNMAPRGVHPGWIRGAPGCTPCICTRCPLYSPSISPLSPLYGGDRWGMVGNGGEAPPEAPRLAAGHPVQCYGGGKSARLFAMGNILEADLVSCFSQFCDTVLQKLPK